MIQASRGGTAVCPGNIQGCSSRQDAFETSICETPMTYPRPSATGAAFGPRRRSCPEPALPGRSSGRSLEFWREDDDRSARRSPTATDAEEWVFYDGPPFANGLPHYGHLLTGYAKDLFPRFQTMRGKKVDRAVRLGHPRPPRRARGDEAARHHREERDRGDGHRGVQRQGREVRAAPTRASGRTTSPGRRAGSTSSAATRRSTSRTWSPCCGRSRRCYDKGLAYEGYRVLPYCWRDETPLSNHELRMDDDVYKMRQDPSVTVTLPAHRRRRPSRSASRPCGRSRGRRRRGPCRRTSPSRSVPTSATSSCRAAAGAADVHREADGTPTSPESRADVPPRRGAAGRLRQGPRLRVRRGRAQAAVRAPSSAPTCRTSPTTACSTTTRMPSTWGTRARARILVDDYVTTGDGTGIVAPGARPTARTTSA